jgi:hypothetical protein
VADGTRTHDHRDHNPGLYQLSYRHREPKKDSPYRARGRLRSPSLATVGTTVSKPREVEAVGRLRADEAP